MNRLRSIFIILGLMVVASLLIACGATAEPAAPTAALSSTSEPSTATPLPSESEGVTTKDEVPRISAAELKQKLDNGEAIVVVDTRGQSSYDTRHIPGAIAAQINYDEFPPDQEIVFYCA